MLYYILLPLGWLLWHIGFRFRVVGRENLIRDRGFILAPNHLSAIDPVFVIAARFWGKKMRVFAKKELFEINPLLSWFLASMGAVAVKTGRDDLDTLDKTVDECRAGRGLLVFPEGTRSKDGQIGRPKSGAFLVAGEAGVDMIPCRIIYHTPDERMHLFCRVTVAFGPAIPPVPFAEGEKRDMKKLRAAKQQLSAAWETLYEANK